MTLPIKLISTDFDGTIFAEFENPPVPAALQKLIGDLQNQGVKWAINTGRDMSSLMEALARSRISIQPDFLVLVEREIHIHDGIRYVGHESWNSACTRAHEKLFARVRHDLPRLTEWINARFDATVYEDPYSPFCLMAGNNGDAEIINQHLEEYCRSIPHLTLVQNDVYARFSHEDFNKGTALAELTRLIKATAQQVFAAGDHLNDLAMLSRQHARWLAAPANAVPKVRQLVRDQGGHLSSLAHGNGVAEALALALKSAAH